MKIAKKAAQFGVKRTVGREEGSQRMVVGAFCESAPHKQDNGIHRVALERGEWTRNIYIEASTLSNSVEDFNRAIRLDMLSIHNLTRL